MKPYKWILKETEAVKETPIIISKITLRLKMTKLFRGKLVLASDKF